MFLFLLAVLAGADGSHDDHEDTKITKRICLKTFVVIVAS
jgi:hypothetical protein